jgi:acyl-coenzyme A synthetase/AMP-(fatty) acid ligase
LIICLFAEAKKHVEFVPELPKTLVGKVLRRELIKMEMDRRDKAQARPNPD